MDRKTLINELEKLNKAYKDYKNFSWDEVKVERNYPKRPEMESPVEPEFVEPSPAPLPPVKPELLRKNSKLYSFSFDSLEAKIIIISGIVFLFIGVFGILVNLSTFDISYWYDKMLLILLVISFVSLCVGGGIFLFKYIKSLNIKKTSDKKVDEANEQINKEINDPNGEYQKKVRAYEEEVQVFLEKMQKFREYKKVKIEEYEQEKAKYEKIMEEYHKEYELCVEKYDAQEKQINDNNYKMAKEKALAKFNNSLKEINLEYPEKYYDSISTIITIIKDCRADSIKEAINQMLIDDHMREIEAQKRYEIEIQEIQSMRERESQRKQEEILKGQRQCSYCAKRYECKYKDYNNGRCVEYEA